MARLTRFHEEALRRTAPTLDPTGVGRSVRAPKTAEIVAHELRRRIVGGELSEGDGLPPEASLMETFGVSRPTLREAYRVLEAENLISVRRGAFGGARVNAPSEATAARYAGLVLEHRGATLADVSKARELIEVEAAKMVAERRTKADLDALRRRQEELSQAPALAPLSWARNSLTFHELMVELTRNETLALFDSMINHILIRAQRSHMQADPDAFQDQIILAHTDHGEMIEIIEARDVDRAAAKWRKHCRRGTRDLLRPGADTGVLDLLGPEVDMG
jgi:DNA-binding FadR family transcriptional regulator